jgi:hypothetical protein
VRRADRILLTCTATVAALVLAGCVSSSSSKGQSSAASPTPARSSHSSRTSPAGALTTPSGTSRGFTPSLAKAADDSMPGYKSTCQVTQHASGTRTCTFGDTSSPSLTVALVGDSVAAEWLAPVTAIGTARHWKIVTEFHSRCPWSAAMTINSGETVPYEACHTWGQAVLQDVLTKIKPDVVITSDRPVLGTPDHPTPGTASFAQIGEGMATYWRTLLDHHIAVAPIRESPEMGFDVPTCLAHNSIAACTVPASIAVTANPPTVAGVRDIGSAVHLVSMNKVICPDGTCTPVDGHIVKFRDRHHLTYTYVMTLVPQLQRRLLATGAFG